MNKEVLKGFLIKFSMSVCTLHISACVGSYAMCHSTRAIYYQSLSMIAHVCLSPRCQWWSVLLLPSLLSRMYRAEHPDILVFVNALLMIHYILGRENKLLQVPSKPHQTDLFYHPRCQYLTCVPRKKSN